MLHFAFLQCSIFMPSYLLTLKCICFILLKILAYNGFALCTCPFTPFHTKSHSLMAQREKNSASAWDFFNLLINISEVLRHIFTCGIDSSTSGNPTPGEVINDVAVLSPLFDISIVNIWIVKCLVGHVIIGWPIAMSWMVGHVIIGHIIIGWPCYN